MKSKAKPANDSRANGDREYNALYSLHSNSLINIKKATKLHKHTTHTHTHVCRFRSI